MTEEELNQFWLKVKDEVKRRRVDLAVWSALEACTPILVEEEKLVLGLKSQDYHRQGHLATVLTRRVMEQVLRDMGGGIKNYEVIPGTTQRDWEDEKERERERRRASEEALERRKAEGELGEVWTALAETILRRHTATQQKKYPQVLVRFLLESLEDLYVVEKGLGEEADTDFSQRGLARMLNRLSDYTGLPAVAVALEYRRLKERKGEKLTDKG